MKQEHFIPYSQNELNRLLSDKIEEPEQKKQFQAFCEMISAVYHFRFQKNLEEWKDAYLPLDPDRTVELIEKRSSKDMIRNEKDVLKGIEAILTAGNYVKITSETLQEAFKKTSPWGINLEVDLNHYEHISLYYRGEHNDSLDRKTLWMKKHFDFSVYSRVVLVFKLRDDTSMPGDQKDRFQKGSLYLKLFKNVPTVDLEMLFPDTRIVIRPIDQAKVIVPLAVGALSTVYKIASYILSDGNPMHLWTQITFWILMGSLFAIALRGFMSYKNTVERYLKTLATSLYFQNLDNNSGVFKCLLDDAEEEECKELILAYYFLFTERKAAFTPKKLDQRVELFFQEEFGIKLDFEVDDAIRKLREIGLLEDPKKLLVLPLRKALQHLDAWWDNYFKC